MVLFTFITSREDAYSEQSAYKKKGAYFSFEEQQHSVPNKTVIFISGGSTTQEKNVLVSLDPSWPEQPAMQSLRNFETASLL